MKIKLNHLLRVINFAITRAHAAISSRDTFLSESGEGVISSAIVVLIMAFLGVGMWIAFKAMMGSATTTISTQISQLGQ